jgi:DNA-binding IclR family transcriptional regulator
MDTQPQVVRGVQHLKALFLEMPGTRLTLADAIKLSGLERAVCEPVLDALEDARFLRRASDGCYHRRTSDSPFF